MSATARRPRRYFDNAATSFPKPPGIGEVMRQQIEQCGASAGRGAYREAVEAGRMLEQTRAAVRQALGCAPADGVIFTLNGTDALNLAIKSLVGRMDHVVTTTLDHNSVLRPLHALQQRAGVAVTHVRPTLESTRLRPEQIRETLRPQTRLVVINHASNVTGVLQPIEEIGEICRERGVPVLVDAAQSAGHVPIEFARLPVDLLACPGHKGLLGPLGTGILVMRPEIAEKMQTVREGGTGSRSENLDQPASLPDKFESGSHNTVGLAGLEAALEWIARRGIPSLRIDELRQSRTLLERLLAIPGLRLFGPTRAEERVGVFSVRVEGFEPAELSAILEESYGVLTRSGLHCAPLAHETIGTLATGGTTRLSLGPFLNDEDTAAAAEALREIAARA